MCSRAAYSCNCLQTAAGNSALLTGADLKPKLLVAAADLPALARLPLMKALNNALRWLVGACLSLVLLYCGIGMIMALVLNRSLPAFPFSWVDWLNRPNLPPVLDHVVNFILTSMVAAVFQDLGKRRPAASAARNSSTVS